jgi:MFS family permease
MASVPGGALSDRVGRRRVIVAGWLLYAAAYLGFARAVSPVQVWALFVVYGIYFGLTEGAEKALVADFVPAHLRGTAYGVYHCAVGVAALPSSLLMGAVWEAFGPAAAFGVGACFAAAAAVLFLVAVPERKV